MIGEYELKIYGSTQMLSFQPLIHHVEMLCSVQMFKVAARFRHKPVMFAYNVKV